MEPELLFSKEPSVEECDATRLIAAMSLGS